MGWLVRHWQKVVLAGGYVVSAILLDLLSGSFVLQTGLAICYPAAGLYLAAILLLGWWALPLAFLNPVFSVLVTLQVPNISLSTVLGIGVTSMISPAIMLAVLRRTPSRGVKLHTFREVLAFVVTALLAVFVESLVAASIYLITDLAPRDTFGTVAVGWWISNVIPYLTLTPVILLWVSPPPGPRLSLRGRSAIQAILIVACVPLAIGIALTGGDGTNVSRLYVGLLPILWAALAGGITAAAWTSLFVTASVLILAPTLLSSIPLIVEAQFFLLVSTLAGLVTGAIVTDRRRTGEELARSEALFQSLIETLPQSIYSKDLAGRFIFANQQYCRTEGRALSDILGKTDFELHPLALAQKYEIDDQRVIETGRVFETIEEHQPLGGEKSYVQVVKAPLRDAGGLVTGTLGIFWDVSARKRAEEQLYASEERYRLISAVISDYTFSTRLAPDGRLQLDWVAGAFESITGYTFEEYVARGGWPAALHPDDVALDARDMAQLRMNQPVVSEVRTIARDGTVRWVRVYAHPVWDQAQNGLIGIYGAVQDISERKQVEQQIRRQATRAETLAEFSQLLTQVSQDYQLVLDTVVRRCADLIGDGASVFLRVPDSPWLELAAVYNPDPQAIEIFRRHMLAYPVGVEEGAYGQVIKTGQPLLLPVIPLEQLIVASSPERAVYYQQLPLYSAMFAPLRAQGQILGVLGLGRHVPGKNYSPEDLTFLQDIADRSALALVNARLYNELQQELVERKRAENQVRQFNVELEQRILERERLIAELEAKNAELERFTYTVSHDLKSPLVTIRGFVGLLEKDALAGQVERAKADVARITAATNKMLQLLNELLELSRVGRMMNPPQTLPFETIVREAIELVRGRIEARGVKIDIASDLPTVYGDRARLVEVVQNLVDNAAKFTGDQPEPRVAIGQRGLDRDGKPIVFVRDNGIGVEPQYYEKVFGLFNKLDAQSEGTGVGLALVKRIVEVHGGRIWIESEGDGQGTTLLFTLPLNPASEQVVS